jgi:carbamoyl-phosphate synthase large subunit
VTEGRPHVVDKIVDGDVDLVINTTFGKKETRGQLQHQPRVA